MPAHAGTRRGPVCSRERELRRQLRRHRPGETCDQVLSAHGPHAATPGHPWSCVVDYLTVRDRATYSPRDRRTAVAAICRSHTSERSADHPLSSISVKNPEYPKKNHSMSLASSTLTPGFSAPRSASRRAASKRARPVPLGRRPQRRGRRLVERCGPEHDLHHVAPIATRT
jgi:hypothetical protein